MGHARFSTEEVGRRGNALYEQSIRSKVETAENIGKLISIDVETGDYEIGEDDNLDAPLRLHARRPGAAVYTLRVGYNAVYALGGSSLCSVQPFWTVRIFARSSSKMDLSP